MKAFSILFAIIAIAEFIGFISGHSWCIYPAILVAALAVFIWFQSNNDYNKSYEPKRERRQAWYKQGNILNRRLSRR